MPNVKGSRETTRNVLDFPKQVKVDEWVRANYQANGEDDTKSAAEAAKALGFPVSPGNIKYFRELHQIPSNYGRRVVSDDYAALDKRVKRLEDQDENHYSAIQSLFERAHRLETELAAFKLAMKFNK